MPAGELWDGGKGPRCFTGTCPDSRGGFCCAPKPCPHGCDWEPPEPTITITVTLEQAKQHLGKSDDPQRGGCGPQGYEVDRMLSRAVRADKCAGCNTLGTHCRPLWQQQRKCCPDCTHGCGDDHEPVKTQRTPYHVDPAEEPSLDTREGRMRMALDIEDQHAAGVLAPVVPKVVLPTPEYLARVARMEAAEKVQREAHRRYAADHVDWYGRLPDPITFK